MITCLAMFLLSHLELGDRHFHIGSNYIVVKKVCDNTTLTNQDHLIVPVDVIAGCVTIFLLATSPQLHFW